MVAGRNQRVLDELVGRGADVAIRVDRLREELAEAIAAAGPYDLIADYLWGPPAEAVFAGLMRLGRVSGTVPGAGAEAGRIRYILVGMTAGEVAGVSALALRSAPVQLAGSGIGGPASLAENRGRYADLLGQVASGEMAIEVETVPLAEVEKTWSRPGDGRRVVFVP